MNSFRHTAAFITAAVMMLISCRERDKDGRLLDTPTSGSIKIAVDESLRPLVDAELATFEALYKRADIEAFYLPEAEAIDALMSDSVRLAVVTRRFLPEEKEYFKSIKITPTERNVAISAVALIVNKARVDTLISMKQLESVLRGEIDNWEGLGSKSKAGIEIVFDNPNSGLLRFLKDSVAKVQKLPPNTFAVNDNEAVIDYVSQNENALGLIGLEWISDKYDSTSNSFLEKINVMSVAGDSTHFKPYQAYLALKYYPLIRRITILSREARSGLGSGFIVFFASERGQRIVLKAGLVPVTMPIRVVEVYREPLDIEN